MPKRKQVRPDDGLGITESTRQKINLILRRLCQIYSINPELLSSRSQMRNIVEPRQLAMLLIRRAAPEMTYDAIGRIFDRTGSTVRSSCIDAYDQVVIYPHIRQQLESLINTLQINLNHA